MFGAVTEDISLLLRHEVELAKAELKQEAAKAGRAGGMFAGTAVAGHMTLLFLSIAVWWGLSHPLGAGWAAVIVAIIWGVIGMALFIAAREQLKSVRGLPHTAQSLEEIPQALNPNRGDS